MAGFESAQVRPGLCSLLGYKLSSVFRVAYRDGFQGMCLPRELHPATSPESRAGWCSHCNHEFSILIRSSHLKTPPGVWHFSLIHSSRLAVIHKWLRSTFQFAEQSVRYRSSSRARWSSHCEDFFSEKSAWKKIWSYVAPRCFKHGPGLVYSFAQWSGCRLRWNILANVAVFTVSLNFQLLPVFGRYSLYFNCLPDELQPGSCTRSLARRLCPLRLTTFQSSSYPAIMGQQFKCSGITDSCKRSAGPSFHNCWKMPCSLQCLL